jgi:hypothetical protein
LNMFWMASMMLLQMIWSRLHASLESILLLAELKPRGTFRRSRITLRIVL